MDPTYALGRIQWSAVLDGWLGRRQAPMTDCDLSMSAVERAQRSSN